MSKNREHFPWVKKKNYFLFLFCILIHFVFCEICREMPISPAYLKSGNHDEDPGPFIAGPHCESEPGALLGSVWRVAERRHLSNSTTLNSHFAAQAESALCKNSSGEQVNTNTQTPHQAYSHIQGRVRIQHTQQKLGAEQL